MSSKYDNIETADELVREVRANGLSTLQEDICRAQDIFGHTSIEELARLANDIGRNNDQGEPDPKGSWSSSRQLTQSTFYSIASCIWNWEEVTRFWNQHTNPEHEELQAAKKRLKDQEDKANDLAANLDREQEARAMVEEGYNRLVEKYNEAERRANAAETKIMALKANLYDLMITEKEEQK